MAKQTHKKNKTIVLLIIALLTVTACSNGGSGLRLTGQERPVILHQTSPASKAEESLTQSIGREEPYWGEDPTTGRIIVDGAIFRLPSSLEQFEAKGWVKGRSLDMLLPHSESVVRMAKGGFGLSLGVINETDRIQELKNCPVFSVRPISPQTGLPIQLTRTLKTGMSSNEAIGFAAPYKPRIKAMDELVFYEVIRNHMKIRLVIDTQREILVSIEYEWKKDFAGPDPVNPLVPG